MTWDTTSIENAEQIKVVLYNSGVTAFAQPLITINPANDMGSATFNGVPDGTYNVVVASFRTGERHKLSPLQAPLGNGRSNRVLIGEIVRQVRRSP